MIFGFFWTHSLCELNGTEINQSVVGVAESDNENPEIIDDDKLERIIKSEIKNHAYWPVLMKEKEARLRQVQVGPFRNPCQVQTSKLGLGRWKLQ